MKMIEWNVYLYKDILLVFGLTEVFHIDSTFKVNVENYLPKSKKETLNWKNTNKKTQYPQQKKNNQFVKKKILYGLPFLVF